MFVDVMDAGTEGQIESLYSGTVWCGSQGPACCSWYLANKSTA